MQNTNPLRYISLQSSLWRLLHIPDSRYRQRPPLRGYFLRSIDKTESYDRRVVQEACGQCHTCPILDDGSIRLFGGRQNGEVSLPDLGNRRVVQADCGRGYSLVCLVLDDGSARIFCSLNPFLDKRRVVHAACGSLHTCLILDDGSVYFDRKNDDGQCNAPNLVGVEYFYRAVVIPTLVCYSMTVVSDSSVIISWYM
eukprot:Mrub_08966.p2 GENE.Mrub_08966~~Mrub_08966.p2  ORF type:complete len:197 (-),score=-30.08 Mrub_08966:99-689(-)